MIQFSAILQSHLGLRRYALENFYNALSSTFLVVADETVIETIWKSILSSSELTSSYILAEVEVEIEEGRRVVEPFKTKNKLF